MAKATTTIPTEPTLGMLMSMAIRFDHGLAVPGFYDQPIYSSSGITHAQRLNSTLTTMRQLYEEISKRGFYSLEADESYAETARAGGYVGSQL